MKTVKFGVDRAIIEQHKAIQKLENRDVWIAGHTVRRLYISW